MPQPRKLPSRSVIYKYWEHKLDARGIEIGGPNTCFACGYGEYVERTHIVSKYHGGPDSVDNIHLLCRGCHIKTEILTEKAYWVWLKNTNQNDFKLTTEHVYNNLVKAGFSWEKFDSLKKIKGIESALKYILSFHVSHKGRKKLLIKDLVKLYPIYEEDEDSTKAE